MGFLSLWPLVFLILVPLIILLYILKQESVTREFSSNLLWQEVYRNMEATKPWEKLKKNLLLFLQIMTVLLFILVLMNPWIRAGKKDGRSLILVVDSSASMGTIYEEEKSRLECAREAALSYVDELGDDGNCFIIDVNQSAVLLANTKDPYQAKESIRKIVQTPYVGDSSSALGLVQSCMNQTEDAQVVFFTDTAFDMGNLNGEIVSLYKDVENLALDTLSAKNLGTELVVLTNVTAYLPADKKAGGEVNLYAIWEDGEEKLLDIAPYEVTGGESQAVYFRIPVGKVEEACGLIARLNEPDALAADNEIYGSLQDMNIRKVLLMSKSNLFLEKAFHILNHVELYRTGESRLPADAQYDLYIFDGMVPQTLPSTGSFLFINCESGKMVKSCGKIEGRKLTIVDNPLMPELAEEKIGVNASWIYELPVWANSYLESSDHACAGYYGNTDGHKLATLGFDLHATDFALQTSFPVLISDLADYLMESGLAEKSQAIAGESVRLFASGEGGNLLIKTPAPDSEEKSYTQAEASGLYLELEKTGLYHLSQTVEGQEKRQYIAVNFPSELESKVEAASNMQNVLSADQVTRGTTMELRNLAALLLLALLVGEWIAYIRLS